MALVVRRTRPIDWPTFGLPVQWSRLFDLDDQERWLPVEELRDGDTIVVRPGMVNVVVSEASSSAVPAAERNSLMRPETRDASSLRFCDHGVEEEGTKV
jgi:hypothetical protein